MSTQKYKGIHVVKLDAEQKYVVLYIYIKNSVFFLVRKRIIPTERPQPAGEVSANFN
jgi:hypothetical protein